MRLMHLADLHIGKRVNEFPMLDDQRYTLEKLLRMVEEGLTLLSRIGCLSRQGDH